MKNTRIKYLIGFIIAILAEIIIAIYVHDNFIRPYIGDVLAVICVYLFTKIIFPKKIKYLSLYVLIFAIFVEVVQYFNLSQKIAGNNKVIKILLGATFDIKDIVCYIIGYIIILITEKLCRKEKV